MINLVKSTLMLPLKYKAWGEVVDGVNDHAMNVNSDVNHDVILAALNNHDSLYLELAYSMNLSIDLRADIINESCSGDMAQFTYQGLHNELYGV